MQMTFCFAPHTALTLGQFLTLGHWVTLAQGCGKLQTFLTAYNVILYSWQQVN